MADREVKWSEVQSWIEAKIDASRAASSDKFTAKTALGTIANILGLKANTTIGNIPMELAWVMDSFQGVFDKLKGSANKRWVAGSVYYPSIFTGSAPVVGATISIERCDPFRQPGTTGENPVTASLPPTEIKTDYQGRYRVEVDFKANECFFQIRIQKGGKDDTFPLIFFPPTGEFLPVIVFCTWLPDTADASYPARENITQLPPPITIDALAKAIGRSKTLDLVQKHMAQIDHVECLFTDHKLYLWQLEKKITQDSANPAALKRFPLPYWNPKDNIPNGFREVLDMPEFQPGGSISSRINPIYNLPGLEWARPAIPPELLPGMIPEFLTADQLANYLGRSAASGATSFHLLAHLALAGPFASMATAASAHIFWPVHALFVAMYDRWVQARFPQRNLKYHIGVRWVDPVECRGEHEEGNEAEADIFNPDQHYLELFTITKFNHLWRTYERNVVYMREDRLGDPKFDPHDVVCCGFPEWPHFSHWENLSVGFGVRMETMGPGVQAPLTAGSNTSGAPAVTGAPSVTAPVRGGVPLTVPVSGGRVIGGVPGNPPVAARRVRTGTPGALAHTEVREVPLAPGFLSGELPAGWEARQWIDCPAVDIRTVTDVRSGKVVVLAKDTNGKLCLMRPADDCCKTCGESQFICTDLGFGRVGDFDFAMTSDGKLVIAVSAAASPSRAVPSARFRSTPPMAFKLYEEKEPDSNSFEKVQISDAPLYASCIRAVRLKNDKAGVHIVFTSPSPGRKLRLVYKQGGQWQIQERDEPALSAGCPVSEFCLEVNTRGEFSLFGTDPETGTLTVKALQFTKDTFRTATWEARGNRLFEHLATTLNRAQEVQLFGIANGGGSVWAYSNRDKQWNELKPGAGMGQDHSGICAKLDYLGCIKIFVHADNNFAYMAEETAPNSGEYIGWLNI